MRLTPCQTAARWRSSPLTTPAASPSISKTTASASMRGLPIACSIRSCPPSRKASVLAWSTPGRWSRGMAAASRCRFVSRAARVRESSCQWHKAMADILVIDDDVSVAQALRRFFESEGHRTRVAASVGDGLASAGADPPDLVMMDVRMPGLDGLAGLSQLQQQHPGLCVVMMTGYGTSQTSIDAIRGGAFDYLTKPVDLAALRQVTARALQSRAHADGGEPAA